MDTRLKTIDFQIGKLMNQWSVPALRISFAIIFFWFGILKPLGYSAAIPIVKSTVAWLPFLKPVIWVALIGWWEVVIGILFLFKKTTRLAIALLFFQMIGTFMPLVLLQDIVYQHGNPLLPTMEGQYIIKNLMIISAALVLGGKIYSDLNKNKNQ